MAKIKRQFYSTAKTGLLEKLESSANTTFVSAINQLLQNFAGPYDNTTTYVAGEYVRYNGLFYRCLVDISTPEEWNPLHWGGSTGNGASRVSIEFRRLHHAIASDYDAKSKYKVGDYVMYNASVYRCSTNITTPEPFDVNHWTHVTILSDNKASYWSGKVFTMFGDSIVNGGHDDSPYSAQVVDDYSASSTYAVKDRAMYESKLYECNVAITTPEPWNAAHWTEINIKEYRGYVRRLVEILGFRRGINRGYSGYSMANGNPAHEESVNSAIHSLIDSGTVVWTNHDLIIIAAGINDFRRSLPLGTLGSIDDTQFDTYTFYGAYRDSIEALIAQNPLLKFCLWTPLQGKSDGKGVEWVNDVGCKLIDYVNAIKDIGQMYGIPVVDLYSISGVNEKNLTAFTEDGIHLNGVGYDHVTAVAASQIDYKM